MEEPPSPITHPKEWKEWYNRKKLEKYLSTHKTVIEWNGEFIAPQEFYGAWIETKYETGHGLCFDFQRFQDGISTEALLEMTSKLADILNLLGDDVDWWSPHIIEIDHKGQCHLLAYSDWSKYEKTSNPLSRTTDMILREGTKRIVKVGA